MARILLWDFDGTLASRDGLWATTLCDVLEKHGVVGIDINRVRPYTNVGFPWHAPETPHSVAFGGKSWWGHVSDYAAEIFRTLGIAESDAARFAADFRGEYLAREHWKAFPDTIETLRELRERGYRQAIASNHVPELAALARDLGIAAMVDGVFTSGLIGFEKPSRQFFHAVLRDLAAAPNDCVMIGDSYSADIAGALRCGIEPILVRSSNEKHWIRYARTLGEVRELIIREFPVETTG